VPERLTIKIQNLDEKSNHTNDHIVLPWLKQFEQLIRQRIMETE
jgi:hypothetical protein